MNNYRMGTKCVQAGYKPGNGEPRQIPIIQSTTFKYDTSEDMGKLFALEAEGYFSSRLQTPTCAHVAAKIAAMEGGTAAMLTSSGQAANFMALFNICECGDHIEASSSIYGGTFNLISVTMAKMGITATFVSPDATEEEIRKETRRACEEYGHLKGFWPGITYGGPGTIYPHVEEIVIDEIDRYNKERFGVAIS